MSKSTYTPATVFDLLRDLRSVVKTGSSLVLDSRQVNPGDVFLACPGLSSDGRDYIAHAVENGAIAVVYEDGLTMDQARALGTAHGFPVAGLRQMLGDLAHQWWQKPSERLKVIAVTGTNGKTTVSRLLASALGMLGKPCAVMGTLGVFGPDGKLFEQTGLTTPDVVTVHRLIDRLSVSGAQYFIMEASSIGLEQGRLDGVNLHAAVFTNLTQDHLDYHKDMQAYGSAKSRLFEARGLVHAILNLDDPAHEMMRSATSAPVVTFGIQQPEADWRATDVETGVQGSQFVLHHGSSSSNVQSCLVGVHNVSNLLAVAATLSCLGRSFEEIVEVLQKLQAIQGRLEPVEPSVAGLNNLPRIFVDYAHTPDALQKLLTAVRDLVSARNARLWCVIGCGGDRDRSKRQVMGQIVSELSDRFVVTSDNPRSEDPQAIIDEVWSGVVRPENGWCEIDREVAILSAIWSAGPDDVVVIAGKGHETYQIVAGKKRFLDDRQWARLGMLFYAEPSWDRVPSVVTDSRKVDPGSFFVAIKGERFDAHSFLDQVAKNGAVAAMVSTVDPALSLPQIHVDDTRRALQFFAKAWRKRFDLPVIAVTGSNGKTTTKEMIAAILRQGFSEKHAFSTQGNLNNDLGVPMTVLGLRPWHKAAVIELGMNHPGEIALLSDIARPTVGLVLNAQREHQEFMQSVDAVAQENGQVLRSLPRSGTAVFKLQKPYDMLWSDWSSHVARQITFGQAVNGEQRPDVYASQVQLESLQSRMTVATPAGEFSLLLPMPGLHNVDNALASIACALAIGVDQSAIVMALEQFQAVKGRMQRHVLSQGAVLIDDTYNANPDSVRAAIDVLKTLDAPRVLVLGDMGEVGDNGTQMHAEVGWYAKECGIEYLFAMGEASARAVEAFGLGAKLFDAVPALVHDLFVIKPASVLVKGSRFMAMERVVSGVLSSDQQESNSKGVQSHVG